MVMIFLIGKFSSLLWLQVFKKAFISKNVLTVWINASSDLKFFANSRSSPSQISKETIFSHSRSEFILKQNTIIVFFYSLFSDFCSVLHLKRSNKTLLMENLENVQTSIIGSVYKKSWTHMDQNSNNFYQIQIVLIASYLAILQQKNFWDAIWTICRAEFIQVLSICFFFHTFFLHEEQLKPRPFTLFCRLSDFWLSCFLGALEQHFWNFQQIKIHSIFRHSQAT